MPTITQIRELIQSFAPYETAMEWDNSGLLLGRTADRVSSVLIALDVTEAVVEEAIGMGAELILTHHPFLFSPLPRVTDETPQGALLLRAWEHHIALLCAHTNLDIAPGCGINATLCELLDIRNPQGEEFLTGRLDPPLPLRAFLQTARERLGCYGLKYTGEEERPISTVSICSGSGSEFLTAAAERGAELLLTADTKYHDHQIASQLGIALADAGHFETERIICPVLARHLREAFPDLTVAESAVHQGFYRYL